MKQIMKTKILRKALVLAFLVAGLAAVLLDSGNNVEAFSCYDSYVDYMNADNAYYDARVLYINNSPTTCDYDCRNYSGPAYSTCVTTCQTTRATNYYSAQNTLFDKAGQTCPPDGLMFTCGDAVQAAFNCSMLYDTSMLTDQDEIDAVYAQYTACRTASHIDDCQ